MWKLLIADSSKSVHNALIPYLSESFCIDYCGSGDLVLSKLIEFQPDILVLELSLPYCDGISILRAAHLSGLHPKVLALTCFTSDYVQKTLQDLHVSYMMMKPCDIRTLSARIYDLARTREASTSQTRRDVLNTLMLSLGLRQNLSGFLYLQEAVLLYFNDPHQSITGELYPAVGQRFSCSRCQAEQAIRSCIHDAWSKRNDSLWHLYFPAGRDGRVRSVTNSQFIAKMAECLHRCP